jgi:phosphoribosyl-AMP cyclohydrolase
MITLDFDKMNGLVPAIAQDHESGQVLMVGFMNRKAWESTLATGRATYWSRSRNKLWVKGDTSGHVQRVEEIFVDCDKDTVLLKVRQLGGAACHKGFRSCFFRKVSNGSLKVTETPVFDPQEVYQQ